MQIVVPSNVHCTEVFEILHKDCCTVLRREVFKILHKDDCDGTDSIWNVKCTICSINVLEKDHCE